jgi:uncharacterized membrane protein YhaH (DUF805 family)
VNWYLDALTRYAQFDGRARRTAYWMFTLITTLVAIALGFIDAALGLEIGPAKADVGVLGILYALLVLVPSIAVAVRRLHDTNRSGWWLLIAMVPLLGVIVLLVMLCLDSTPGDNRFGPNPKLITAP